MTIALELLEAYVKCPTKCWLISKREPISDSGHAQWVQARNEAYLASGVQRLLSGTPPAECVISPSADTLKTGKWGLATNVVARAQCLESHLHAVKRMPSEGRGKPAQYSPVRFVPNNRLGKDARLLLAFDALALAEVLGEKVSFGQIIHGDDHTTLKVRIPDQAGEVQKHLEEMTALLSSPSPPDLSLIRHCSECQFRSRCRQKAVEKDDLSLLSGMTVKEPSGSFHNLTHWIGDNAKRIDSRFHFLAAELEWFHELHGIRTNLAGYDTLVYTNRVTLSFGVGTFGRIETRILREKRGQPQSESHKISLTPLLPFIKRLTRAMLNVSEQLAVAIAAYRGFGAASQTHAICGVYVPALHALDSYEPPGESPRLKIVAKCVRKCQDYATASAFGFPDGHWWQFLIRLMGDFNTIPVYLSEFEEDSGGVLLDWRIIFAVNGQRLGIAARDTVKVDETSLRSSQRMLEEFVANAELAKAVLVSCSVNRLSEASLASPPLVVSDPPADAAGKVFELLTSRI